MEKIVKKQQNMENRRREEKNSRFKPFSWPFLIILILTLIGISLFIQLKDPVVSNTLKHGIIDLGFNKNVEYSYEVNENTAYIDDNRIYLGLTPEVIYDDVRCYDFPDCNYKIAETEVEFMPKSFSGEIDVCFGFNTTEMIPMKAELYNPRYYNKTSSYTCEYEFNFTTNPKHFWCYKDEVNGTTIIYEHDFEYGDISTKTAYWNNTLYKEYWDISGRFDKKSFEYDGKNTWYCTRGLSVNENQTYNLKVPVIVKSGLVTKYDIAMKLTADSLQEAISNDRFYLLDPFVNETGSAVSGISEIGLYAYYPLNETSGNAEDKTGNNSAGTSTGIVYGNEGIINNSFTFDAGSSDNVNTGYTLSSTAVTVNMWVYFTSSPSATTYRAFSNEGSNVGFIIQFGAGNVLVRRGDGSAIDSVTSNYDFDGHQNEWHMITGTWDDDTNNLSVYIDGAYDNSISDSGDISFGGNNFLIGNNPFLDRGFPGRIDEVYIFTRALNYTEIENMYNSGSPAIWVESTAGFSPVVTLISPDNYENYTITNTVNFEYNCTDDIKVDNCTLNIGGSPVDINTSGVNGTYYYSAAFSDGYHNWSVTAVDNESQSTTSETRYFNVSYVTGINATAIYPSNGITLNVREINFSAVATDNFGIDNVSLYIDSFLNETNTSGVNGSYLWNRNMTGGVHTWHISVWDNDSNNVDSSTNTFTIDTTPFIEFLTPPTLVNYANISQEYIPMKVNVSTNYFQNITYSLRDVNGTNYTQFYENQTFDINFTNMPDAHYHYDVTICTTTNQCNVTETRHVNYDNTSPVINVSSPVGTYSYLYEDYNLTLNYTVTDIHLDTCWFGYDGVNTTLPCENATLNTTYFNYTVNVNTLTFYANDTLGSINSSTILWTPYVVENSQTYNNQTIEGTGETFKINMTFNSTRYAPTVYLVYDGTEYAASTTDTGNTREFTRTITIPNVAEESNITFYWNFDLSGSPSVEVNSTPFLNQTVQNLIIGNCTAYPTNLFNITMEDEALQTSLNNITLETAIEIYDNTGTTILSNFSTLSTSNPSTVCINLNVTGTTDLLVDATIKYTAVGYAIEYYNIQNLVLNNETGMQNITLYDLNSSDSTDFKLSVTGTDSLPVEDALVYIDRQYVSENVFKTVEIPKSDSNGETVGHLVRSDVVYNIRVVKDGELIVSLNNVRAFCADYTIGSCEIELSAVSTADDLFNYNDFLGIIYSSYPTYDSNTSTISFDYTSSNGEAKTVRMEVTRNDVFGNRSICNDTITSASGSLSCSIDPSISDTSLVTKVYVNGNQISSFVNKISDTAPYGTFGYIVWFILTLVMVLMTNNKSFTLIGITLAYIGAVALGVLNANIIGLGSAGIWIITITIIGVWKINKENPQ